MGRALCSLSLLLLLEPLGTAAQTCGADELASLSLRSEFESARAARENAQAARANADAHERAQAHQHIVAGWEADAELVLYLRLDEGASWDPDSQPLRDLSQYGNDPAGAQGGAVGEGRYCRGRRFEMDGPQGLNVPASPSLEFGTRSFSVSAWAKHTDYTNPATTLAAKDGHGCYFHHADEHESGEERAGWSPGWEIGHGFQSTGSDVCIRDADNHKARGSLVYDAGSRPPDLLGQWVHYAFVFDREAGLVSAYINGVRQQSTVDISEVTGSIDNDHDVAFGTEG